MKKIVINKLKCLRCGHRWVPRKKVVTTCPGCKSPYWYTAAKHPRRKK